MVFHPIIDLFEKSGIEINGPNAWDIQVHDHRWSTRVLKDKNLGLGESYMDGWWDCRRIDEMIFRLLRTRADQQVRGAFRYLFSFLPEMALNMQSLQRSIIVAEKHYDIGNDLFFSFLDPYRQYSCGYFKDTAELEQAQINKMDLIASKLDISPQDHLLDIGCGWGGLAHYASNHYGCTVTAVNISQEQLCHARDWCKHLPVYFQECDYRAIEGHFDKVVSVGMFEHVGWKNYPTFMKCVFRALQDDGIFLLHTIGSNISKLYNDQWITSYIFPNSLLPSIKQIAEAAEGLFVIEDLHNLGPHYDKTLMAWNERFQKAWPSLANRYDTRFKRMWEYYLQSCAGAFRSRSIQLWQFVMTKAGCTMTPPPRQV